MTDHPRAARALVTTILLPASLAAVAIGAGALGAGAFDADAAHTNAPVAPVVVDDRFQHAKHEKLFPLCETCHAGVNDAAQSVWPSAAQCTSCHDGTIEARVDWQPRPGPRKTNVRFTHPAHARAAAARNVADTALARNCAACHTERGASRMAVQNAVVGQCIDCHGLTAPHFDVPSAACATCHMSLSEAATLTREDIARFPKPSSHDTPGYAAGGHGKEARGPGPPGTPRAVAASCATCHVQNFCITCHVDAPESPVITALARDDRSPPFASSVVAPPSHASASFLRTHGRDAQRRLATCATCHTQESCTSCHVGVPPRAIARLAKAGEGRAPGARVERRAPATHTRTFIDRHGSEASARPATCESCHVRDTCLECHRPEGAQRTAYHPNGFLTRHPSAAYTREASCSDCHNPAQFCQSCHQQSGLVANSRLGTGGYHDAFRGFSLGHGQAARQTLESCASCHAERDCTACHSAVSGGFRFNPHGPGFNAARARSKNPTLCTACHGQAVPR